MSIVKTINKDVVITTHKNMDFDALASSVAANLIYKYSLITVPDSLNTNVKAFLSLHKEVFNYVSMDTINLNSIKILVVVDTSGWKRIEKGSILAKRANLKIVLWDHHMNGGDIKVNQENCVSEPVGATITLLVKEIIRQKIKISPVQATLFLLGLYEDTGNLTFISSTSEDAYIAGYLLENKADLNIVNRFLQTTYDEKQKIVFFRMLKKSSRIKINGFSISVCDIELKQHINNLASVMRIYRDVINVDLALGLFFRYDKKFNSKCIVIGRSRNKNINVGKIMKKLGGGGHAGAGSAILKLVDVDKLKTHIIRLISEIDTTPILIKDIMSFPIFSLKPNIKLKEAEKIMIKRKFTGMPVIENGKLLGIISKRDCIKANKLFKENSPVKAFMSKNVKTVSSNKTPLHAAKIMMQYDIGRLLVTDNSRIVGILTRSDSMSFFYDCSIS